MTPLISRGEPFEQFGRGHHEVRFCEIIFNLDQWLRRCGLKYFLVGALTALLFSGVEPFVQFGSGHYRKQSVKLF